MCLSEDLMVCVCMWCFAQGCQLVVTAQSSYTSGSITTQNQNDPHDGVGFVFLSCIIMGMGNVYLGRAWGSYSCVVFMYTYMSNIIVPDGWYDWGQSALQGCVHCEIVTHTHTHIQRHFFSCTHMHKKFSLVRRPCPFSSLEIHDWTYQIVCLRSSVFLQDRVLQAIQMFGAKGKHSQEGAMVL